MTTITDVRTIAIDVADQDAAIAYYVETLGFEKRLDAPIISRRRGGSRSRRRAIGLDRAQRCRGLRPSVDGYRRAIRGAECQRGARLDAEAWRQCRRAPGLEGVPPMFTFDDPDGNRFYVVEAMK